MSTTRAAGAAGAPCMIRILLLALLTHSAHAVGANGLAQFCFDDSGGISATGQFSTCARVQQGGYCSTPAFSKFCHKTCLICTDAPTKYPTCLPTRYPTNVPTTRYPTNVPTTKCADDEAALIAYLIRGGKKDNAGLQQLCQSVLKAGFCTSHRFLSSTYCSRTCGLCDTGAQSVLTCANMPCHNGGTCVGSSQRRRTQSVEFKCLCARGFSGALCSTSTSAVVPYSATAGKVWTLGRSPADNYWRSVAYGNGLWVAVAGSGSGNRVMSSADGKVWTLGRSPADN